MNPILTVINDFVATGLSMLTGLALQVLGEILNNEDFIHEIANAAISGLTCTAGV